MEYTAAARGDREVGGYRAPSSRQTGTRVNSPKCTHSFLYMPAARASPYNPRAGRIQRVLERVSVTSPRGVSSRLGLPGFSRNPMGQPLSRKTTRHATASTKACTGIEPSPLARSCNENPELFPVLSHLFTLETHPVVQGMIAESGFVDRWSGYQGLETILSSILRFGCNGPFPVLRRDELVDTPIRCL